MKRMVKNGDLIDVEPDGTITVAGKPVGGGGSDYTAGSNININASNEISLKTDLTGIDGIRLKSQYDDVGISAEQSGHFVIKTYGTSGTWPVIRLRAKDASSHSDIILSFKHNLSMVGQTISFRAEDSNDSIVYAFLTRGNKVPFVPSNDGTYVLKATVSGGNVTYTWVAE